MKPTRSTHLTATVLMVVVLVVGCSGTPSESTPTPTPSQTPTPTATQTPLTPEEEAKNQLQAYLEYRDQAMKTTKLDLTKLRTFATGNEFLRLQQYVADFRSANVKTTGEYVHTLGAAIDRGNRIEISDCEDRSAVKRTIRGKPVPPVRDEEGNTVRNPLRIDYTMVQKNDTWLVTQQNGRLDVSC